MDQFFEAWLETIFRVVAQRTGGQMKVGRKRETTYPINWEPPYLGSQKSLVPDVWLEWDSVTLIVDAKYVLQVLAYANLARTSKVITCLAYPCSPQNWASLRERRRLIHRADLTVGSRSLQLWLTALPMATAVERIAVPLADEVRQALLPS